MINSARAIGLALAFSTTVVNAGGCFEDWWTERIAALESARTGAAALLPLRQLESLKQTAADPDLIDRRYESIARAAGTDPLVAAELDTILLWRDLNRGDFALANARRTRLGMVTRYLVAGPRTGAAAPPSLTSDDLALWREIDTAPLGPLPFDQLLTPATRGRAYAAFYFKSSVEQEIALRWGADDRVEVAIDGVTALVEEQKHDAGFDQQAIFVRVVPGWHRVTFMVEQDDGAWSLTSRLTKLDGTALNGIEWNTPSGAARTRIEQEIAVRRRAGVKLLHRGRRLTDDLEQTAKTAGPRGAAELAVDLAARRLPSRLDSRPLELARSARSAAPNDPLVLWANAAVETDPTRRREAIEALLTLAPDDPAALRGLLLYRVNYGQYRAALELARRAQTACGSDDPYLAAWQSIARDGDGFPSGVVAALSAIAQRFPRQPIVLQQLAAYARREGLLLRARATLTNYLSLARGDEAARSDLLALLGASGDTAGGMKLIDEALEIFPLSSGWWLRKAGLLQREGRAEEALALLDREARIFPNQPAWLGARAETLLALGRRADAAATFTAVRERSGGEGSLDERIAALTGSDASFGTEWTVSLDEARAIEKRRELTGDPPYVVISKTNAWRIQTNGTSEQFLQVLIRIRHPERADGAKSNSITYAPTLQRASIIEARLIRQDGTVLPASRGEQPLLPDPELRMWYDSRLLGASFPRFEVGDLLEIRFSQSDRSGSNEIADGYFGDLFVFGDDVPVLSSRVVVDAPVARPVRHQLVNMPAAVTPRVETRGDRQVTVIELPALPGFASAVNAPPPLGRLPYVVVGTAQDWNQLGQQYAQLIQDARVLDPDVKAVVAQVIAKRFRRREIVQALYDWVIENTRYVALEFGIHAIKPYAAPLVYRRRHGDCKDKATLLVAMLAEAGVRAQVALVRTRDRGTLDTTVPVFAAFDHAIVYVPGEDLWLDGTVLHHGLEDLPLGDRGCLALVIDEAGGGTLTTTPEAQPGDATLTRRETVRVEPSGAASVEAEVNSRGETAARDRSLFRRVDQPGRVLQGVLRQRWPDLSLVQAAFPQVALDDRDVRFSFGARIERYALVSSNRLSIPLSFTTPELPLGAPAGDRNLPLQLPPPGEQRVESTLVLPPRSRLLEPPQPGVAESAWGRVEIQTRAAADGLKLAVTLQMKTGIVALSELPQLATFLERARQLLEQRIVVEVGR